MGSSADNYLPNPDLQILNGILVLVGVQPRIHREGEIDDVAPYQAVGSTLSGIHTAPSLSTFNTRMSAAYPNWWPQHANRWGLGMFLAVTGQPG